MSFRTRRRIGATFVDRACVAARGIHPRHGRRGEQRTWRCPSAFFVRLRLLELRHRPDRGKGSAIGTDIIIAGHGRVPLNVWRKGHVHTSLDPAAWTVSARIDVEVKNLGRQPKRGAGIGDIHHATDVALNRRRA